MKYEAVQGIYATGEEEGKVDVKERRAGRVLFGAGGKLEGWGGQFG